MTTTTADALEVLTLVSACHRRTAPKLDDRQAAMATAGVWAELFNAHKLALPDLLDAVKLRAQSESDAPEPADIITFARRIRAVRSNDTLPTDAYEALCESKAEDAAELAVNRRQRELAPVTQRPALKPLVSGVAARKAVG